jgi:hydrogenase maturation protease
MRVLVLGVGNDLRRDDGAGPAVASSLPPIDGVDVRTVPQLLPELAADLPRYDRVVVVDAVAGGNEVGVRTVAVAAAADRARHSHHVLPGDLLALAALCGDTTPTTWLVTVPAADFGVGEGLSASTTAHVARAVEFVLRLLV